MRALYPALADGHAYLDGAAGTQVPVPVIDAIADAYRAGIGNLDGAFAASQRSDAIVARARAAVADLVGGTADGVVFGPSATTLAYRFSEALSRQWTTDDEIVVSRLDHDSNVRPWIQAAGRVGALVRWAEFDLVTGELPADAVRRAGGAEDPAGRGDGRVERDRHPARRGRDRGLRARGRRALLRRRRARNPARAGRHRRARGGLLRHQRLQVVGAARSRRGGRPGPARDGLAGQARPVLQRGAVAVRARHAAVRRPGGDGGGGGPPGWARGSGRGRSPGGGRDPPGADPRVDGDDRGPRGRVARPPARRAGAVSAT